MKVIVFMNVCAAESLWIFLIVHASTMFNIQLEFLWFLPLYTTASFVKKITGLCDCEYISHVYFDISSSSSRPSQIQTWL